MAFISSARFIAKFDALPLIDSVSGNLFRVFGSSANILEGNLGFDMQQGQHIERDDVSLSVSNKMTVGFWLKPANPGQVRNSSTGDLESLNISLFDIREPTTTNDLILLVHERTDPDGVNNTLRAIFYDSSGADFVINSSKYSVDNWHHFWIVYDGPGSSVQLFIAGTTTIYIRVTFADYLDNNEFTFNFIQQGINDQYALDLTKSQEGVYTGSFNIQNSDGFFNKDGLSAIVVNVPDPCTKLRDVICSGNQADLLNPNLANVVEDFKVAYSGLKSIDADSVYKRLKTSKLSHLTNVDSFKQLYSVDDPRFTFGNPKFFIQK